MPREIMIEYEIETLRLACDQVANSYQDTLASSETKRGSVSFHLLRATRSSLVEVHPLG